jgi:preprotein translocase subunit SecD
MRMGKKYFGLSVVIVICFSLIQCQSKPTWKQFQGGIEVVLEAESKGDASIDDENIKKIAEIIAARLEKFGFKKRIIRINDNRQIVIQLPPCKNPDRVVQLISKSAVLEFKLVDEENSLEDALKGNVPLDGEILYQADGTTGDKRNLPILVKRKVLLSGEYLDDAKVAIDSYNNVNIAIVFNPEGARIFEKITAENIDRRLAIVFDGIVNTAPVIMEKISGGRAQISGNFTMEEARDLSIVLKSGCFPVRVNVIKRGTLNKDDFIGMV